MNTQSDLAKSVREVFLVPPNFDSMSATLRAKILELPPTRQYIGDSFVGSLRGVVTTLSIPFQYTQARVQSLHWQRIFSSERIRADVMSGKTDGELAAKEATAFAAAQDKFKQYLRENIHEVGNQVLSHFAYVQSEEEQLAAARELMRQGIVLLWSAFEVFARDLFVDVLNEFPSLIDRLLNDAAAKKRFGFEKIDWQTLANYGFDLSRNVGTLLTERVDLDDIQTIRDGYNALYSDNSFVRNALGDVQLWRLFQQRNLIVHRRGVIDQQYIDKTGDTVVMGTTICITPNEIEQFFAVALNAGSVLVTSTAS